MRPNKPLSQVSGNSGQDHNYMPGFYGNSFRSDVRPFTSSLNGVTVKLKKVNENRVAYAENLDAAWSRIGGCVSDCPVKVLFMLEESERMKQQGLKGIEAISVDIDDFSKSEQAFLMKTKRKLGGQVRDSQSPL